MNINFYLLYENINEKIPYLNTQTNEHLQWTDP